MIGRKIGRFVVERALGRGGMGAVYAARDEILDRVVALKVLPAAHEADPDRRQRLLREARSAAALSHPNVATVFEAGEDGGVVYLAMELVRGVPLASRIASGPAGLDELVQLAVGIARGLACAHAAGVVHRDLKPANVMLAEDGTPKLVDFGLARPPRALRPEEAERESLTGVVVGTPGYMAPEQLRGEDIDARTDLFALGVVMYELWTGSPPFGDAGLATMARTLYDEAPALDGSRAGAPPALVALVGDLLRKEPHFRPATATEVLARLTLLGAALDVGPPDTSARARGDARAEHASAPTLEAPLASVRPRPALTASLTTLLGRDADLANVERALDEGARVLTVTGAPGIGKSALGLALAERARARGTRVTTALLGSMGAIDEAEAALRLALGREGSRAPLLELLALESGLVVIDGGEAISPALAARLETWLEASSARFLLLRRAELELPAERVVALGPLPAPAARELFVARARKARPGLEIGADELEAVDRIVHLLDGSPLALGLAAARVALLAPSEIAARLAADAEERLRLLHDRRAPASISSLRDAIAWSFELLEPDARRVAGRLSIFESAFDLEAAEAVTRLAGDDLDGTDVLDAVESLRRASLVRASSDERGRTRLQLDVNVRAFARGLLRQDPREREAREAFVHQVGATARAALAPSGRPSAAAAELSGSLRAAAREAVGARALLVPGLWAASLLAAHHADAEAEELLRRLLEDALRDVSLPLDALVHAELALAGRASGRDVQAAVAPARSAVAHAETSGARALVAHARGALFDALLRAGSLEESDRVARAMLAEARGSGSAADEVDALERLSMVAWRRSALEDALAALRRALDLAESLRDRRRQANVLFALGIVCVQMRRFAEARGLYGRARELARAEHLPRIVATISNNLGVVQHEEDELDEARASFLEAAAQSAAAGSALLRGVALGNAGMVDHEAGRLADARVELDEALRVLTAIGDVRFRTVFHGARAALLADEGLLLEARRELEIAGSLLGSAFEPQLALALSVRSAHVELAEASSQPHGAEALGRAHAAAHAYLAEGALEDAIAARSDLARMALRALRRRLDREGAREPRST